MMLQKENQLIDSEHTKKEQILTSLKASTNRLQDIKPSKAIL